MIQSFELIQTTTSAEWNFYRFYLTDDFDWFSLNEWEFILIIKFELDINLRQVILPSQINLNLHFTTIYLHWNIFENYNMCVKVLLHYKYNMVHFDT